MRYREMSIDIETLGTKPGSVVLSIGVVGFEVNKAPKELLNVRIDVLESLFAGLKVDESTLAWWRKQSREAKQALTMGTLVSSGGAINALNQVFEDYATDNVRVWMKGPSFDGAHLAAMADLLSKELPWQYWSERCVRTICDGVKEPARGAGNVHHGALDDAMHQAKWVRKAIKQKGGC